MNEEQEMVLDYHKKMGFTINDRPTPISQIQVKDRSDILQEEVSELRNALESEDLVGICDGLGDVLYVVYGTAVACGIDMSDIFKEIHRSNMTKTPPSTSTGKAIKGESYSPPNLNSFLKETAKGDRNMIKDVDGSARRGDNMNELKENELKERLMKIREMLVEDIHWLEIEQVKIEAKLAACSKG